MRARRRRTGPRLFRAVLLLSAALAVVTWRQTRGLELEREVSSLSSEWAIAETERVELVRRIEELRSRARVVRVARDRLGMHVARDSEIVFLPAPVAVGVAP